MIKIKILLLYIIVVHLFTSCAKDNIDENTIDPITFDPKVTLLVNGLLDKAEPRTSGEGLDLGCFIVQYPFSLLDENGKTYPITNESEFTNLIADTSILIVDFVYPITINDRENNLLVIESANLLANNYTNCIPESGWEEAYFAYFINYDNSCYELQFPVNLILEDNSTYIAKNENEFNTVVSSNIARFGFPLKLVGETGEINNVNDGNELTMLLFRCNDVIIIDPNDTTFVIGELGCYSLIYPFFVYNENNDTLAIPNKEEFFQTGLNGKLKSFLFPIQITKDGETNLIDVLSESELETLLNDCYTSNPPNEEISLLYFGEIGNDSIPCFNIHYPIKLNKDSGGVMTEIIIKNHLELGSSYFSNDRLVPIYPITITKASNSQIYILNNKQDIYDQLSGC